MDSEPEPKTAAEMKEIRLNRKAAQDAEGIKAMADIAAADIAIRKRTENLRAMRLAKEAADAGQAAEPKPKKKEDDLMSKDDRDRAEVRFNKAERAAHDAKSGKTERDAAAKAVIDNMAKLKALRLAREAASPAPAVVKKKTAGKSGKTSAGKTAGDKTPALADWLAGQQSGGRRT